MTRMFRTILKVKRLETDIMSSSTARRSRRRGEWLYFDHENESDVRTGGGHNTPARVSPLTELTVAPRQEHHFPIIQFVPVSVCR